MLTVEMALVVVFIVVLVVAVVVVVVLVARVSLGVDSVMTTIAVGMSRGIDDEYDVCSTVQGDCGGGGGNNNNNNNNNVFLFDIPFPVYQVFVSTFTSFLLVPSLPALATPSYLFIYFFSSSFYIACLVCLIFVSSFTFFLLPSCSPSDAPSYRSYISSLRFCIHIFLVYHVFVSS